MSTSELRVLMVEQGLADSGGLRANVGFRQRWRESGVDVETFLVRAGEGEVAEHRRVEPVTVGVLDRHRLRHAFPVVGARLVRAARRSDVVLSGSEVGVGLWLSYLAGRLTRRPVAAIIHASPEPAARAWVSRRLVPLNGWVLRHLDAAVCVATDLATDMVRLGLPASRTTVVHNTTDVDAVRTRAAAEPAPGIPSGTIVAVGRLVDQKGFDVLLRALAQVRATVPGAEVVIMGEGDGEAGLRSLADDLQIADAVHLVGRVEDPHPVTARSAVFCQPSRYEGASLALLEALALGVPIIASRSGSGAVDALADGRHGDLVPVDDDEALADALVRHLAAPDRLRRMAEAGSVELRERTPQRVADQYVTVLNELVRPSSRRAHRTAQPSVPA